jgi:hypothetical protein
MAGRSEDLAELERIEAAFRRAAHRALYGTREERSGRFLPRKPADAAQKKSEAGRCKAEPADRSRG